MASTRVGAKLVLGHVWLHHGKKYNLLSRGEALLTHILMEFARADGAAAYNLGVKGESVTLAQPARHRHRRGR